MAVFGRFGGGGFGEAVFQGHFRRPYDLESVLRRSNLAVAIPFCWWRFHRPFMVCFGRLRVFVAANFGGLGGVGLGIYSVGD